MLLGLLCVLTLVVLVSALRRLGLYEDAFGFTVARLAGHATILWIGGVLLLVMAAAVLRGTRWLALALAGLTGACLLAFTLANPEGLVAERNVDRFRERGKLDLDYLRHLSADATPALAALPPSQAGCAIADQAERLRRKDGFFGANAARARGAAGDRGSAGATGVLRRPAFGIAVALAAGVALGLSGRVSDYLGPELRLLFALGAPWFLVAFGVGAAQRRTAAGAAGGSLALAVSVAVYYAVMLTVERRGGHGYAASMTVLWGVAAAGCGLLFGAAGAAAANRRDRPRGAGVALLGGTLAGEALFFLVRGGVGAGGSVLACELAAGATLVLAASRPPRAVLVAFGASAAVVSASADGVLRALMRARGWGG